MSGCNTQFDRLMRECRIQLPGALDDVIKVEFFDVADEFFKTTHLWQEVIDLGVTTGRKDYEIDSNEWLAIIDILMGVCSNSIPIDATMAVPGELVLRYDPSNDAIYNVTVALTVAPCDDGHQCGCGNAGCCNGFPQIPIWILQKYRETFKDGVLAHMMSQLAKPYYNQVLGAYHAARFRNGMSYARMQALHQNIFDAQAWQFPQNFATGRR